MELFLSRRSRHPALPGSHVSRHAKIGDAAASNTAAAATVRRGVTGCLSL